MQHFNPSNINPLIKAKLTIPKTLLSSKTTIILIKRHIDREKKNLKFFSTK